MSDGEKEKLWLQRYATGVPYIADHIMDKLPTSGGVLERMSYLLKTGFQSDCSFLVGDGLNPEEFNAHRLILGSSSPVFRAMLFGPLAERGVIKVIDMCPEVFKVLLEFVYTDGSTMVSLEHACGVLYAATKYILPELTKQSAAYIAANVGPQTSCAVLELARSLGVSELGPPCVKVICKNGEEVLASNELLTLSGASLAAVLRCDDLQVEDETVVFAAAQRWARAQANSNCEENEELTDAGCIELRAILRSSGVLAQVRFLTMTMEQFTNGLESPANSGVLTAVEIRAITSRINRSLQDSNEAPPPLPPGISPQRHDRVRLPMPVRRPQGTVVRRCTVKGTQLMHHIIGQSSFVMELGTSDNVILTGLSFCTQIPGIEDYVRGRPSPPDVYTEEIHIQVLSRRGDAVELVGRTNFKGILPYNGVATVALTQPLHLSRGRDYSVMVTLLRSGDYPVSILSQREFHSGIGFRFEDFTELRNNQQFSQDLGFVIGIVFTEA